MPASKKTTKRAPKKSATRKSGKKRSGSKKSSSSFMYNPMDPFNQYPNHETGEEEYGPIPPFGYNKHDIMNMKPFNPNAMNAMFGGGFPAVAASPLGGIAYGAGAGTLLMPPPFNMLGIPGGIPNPAAPLLRPMVPGVPTASNGVSSIPALPQPGVSPMFPQFGYGVQAVSAQNYHPTDPNNQFPNPLTGSMTQPGPALEGGMNAYDPYNNIGAPLGTPEQNRATVKQMKGQPRHPRSPYIID